MKLFWTGSDALFATRLTGVKFPVKWDKWPYMVFHYIMAKVADKAFEGHIVVHEKLIDSLRPLKLKKPIQVIPDPPRHPQKVAKVPHKAFNIVYYRGTGGNMPFQNWVYGYDIMQSIYRYLQLCEAKELSSQVNWVNGSNELSCAYNYEDTINIVEIRGDSDMKVIYQYADLIVRPNRHDGEPRMIMEAEINNIPFVWTRDCPTFEKILFAIKAEARVKNFIIP